MMNTQHAPSPSQALGPVPAQSALMIPQSISGTKIRSSNASPMKVSATLSGDDRRWALIQLIWPSSSLHQRDRAVVDVHGERDGQADHQIDRHRHGDDLDGLAGLVERGSHEHGDEVG